MMVVLNNRGVWLWTIKTRFSRHQQNASLGTKESLHAPRSACESAWRISSARVIKTACDNLPQFFAIPEKTIAAQGIKAFSTAKSPNLAIAACTCQRKATGGLRNDQAKDQAKDQVNANNRNCA
jgi:hypothetical protein